MKVIIVGCGRVGAYTAASLARQGHEVVVIDKDPQAFRLLPHGFSGRTIKGYAFDRDVLEEAGIAEADALVAATSGDNTNAVSARIAKEVYRVPDVVSRIYDPQRAEIYRHYGIQTFAPTAWSAGRIIEFLVSGNIEREESFGNGEVEMIAAFVPRHLIGKPVNDLRILGEIRVGLIVRMGKAMLPVSGTDVRGGRSGLRPRAPGRRREVPEDDGVEGMKVVVGGGGTLGRRVTKYVSERHDVTMIEKDPARFQAMVEAFAGWKEVTVLLGDIDEPGVLLDAGVDRADVFVAATGDDEDNLVGCLLAKNEFKVKRVIGTVRNPRNRWLYNRSWGVDVAIDAAQIVTRIIEEEATLTDLVRLLDLREGEVTLSAMTATEGGKLAGKTFDDLGVPEGCYPVALLRGTELVMPGKDVRIQVGDALLILAGPGGSCKIDTIG